MVPSLDESQVLAWLTTLYGDAEGYVNIVSTGSWAGRCFRDLEAATAYVSSLDALGKQGIYARVTTLASPPTPDSDGNPRRGSVEDTHEFIGFWADLDLAGPGHKTTETLPSTYEDLAAILDLAGLPQPTEWVSSGGGMYPWWLLPNPMPLRDAGALAYAATVADDWQKLIELASNKLGFHYGSGVGDLARVLRVPGTVNRKVRDNPRMCEWRIDLTESRPRGFAELVDALEAGLARLSPPKVVPKTSPVPVQRRLPADAGTVGVRPGDDFNAKTTWHQLLLADGAQVFRDRGAYVEWTRPGKDRRDGSSATSGYMGSDVLKIFTDAWPGLRQGETYDRFGYYAHTRHNGDIREAARALSMIGYGDKGQSPAASSSFSDPTYVPKSTPKQGVFEEDHIVAEGSAVYGAKLDLPLGSPKQLTYTFSDSGFADRMLARHGKDWRYVTEHKKWYHWEGGVWRADRTNHISDLVNDMAMEQWARTEDEQDEAEKLRLQRGLKSMLNESRQTGTVNNLAKRREIAVSVDSFDADRSYLTCSNGTLNLTDYSFIQHNRDHLATKKINVDYDPQATAPGWEDFLAKVMPNPAVRDYLQRAMGYTLTGDTDRKALFLIHGPSHTGKSQFLNCLEEIFGDFAATADANAFATKDHIHGPNPSLHKLRAARLVTASESSENMPLNEALVKRITGGDKLTTRTLYQEDETWKPQFAVWIATNHLPRMSSDDNAIWRRVKPIKFDQVFGVEGRTEIYDIGRKLAASEGAGILNWLLEGIKKYREHGLGDPDEVRQGVAEYQVQSDPVARFIEMKTADQVLVQEPDAEAETQWLYSMFRQWCEDEGIRWPLAKNRFGMRLSTLGFVNGRDASGAKRVWKGIGRGSTPETVWLGSRPLSYDNG